MSTLLSGPGASVADVVAAWTRVRAAHEDIGALPGRVRDASADLDWAAPSAGLFRARMEELCTAVRQAEHRVDEAVRALRTAMVRARWDAAGS